MTRSVRFTVADDMDLIDRMHAQGDAGFNWLMRLGDAETWRDRDGITWTVDPPKHPIMEQSHRLNLLRWLRSNAPQIATLVSCVGMSRHMPDSDKDYALDIENEMDREADEALRDPLAWLESQPLVKKLIALTRETQ